MNNEITDDQNKKKCFSFEYLDIYMDQRVIARPSLLNIGEKQKNNLIITIQVFISIISHV